MSEKELALRLLEHVPAHKLGYVIAYLQGITADDAADDAFCERLLQAYEADPEKGQTITMAEMIKLSEENPDAV